MMGTLSRDLSPDLAAIFSETARQAQAAGAFAEVAIEGGAVSCRDPIQPEASFRIESEGDRLFVSWASADRYLSQSIEAELSWTGDDLDDLIDEEAAAQRWGGPPLGRVEHFRDESRRFVFRSMIPAIGNEQGHERAAAALVGLLLAYQAAFRYLGDMKAEAGKS